MDHAGTPSGHVIVCGLHGVGMRTVEQLRAVGCDRGTRFRGGDRAYLVGAYEELIGVLQQDQRGG